jgi:fructose-1,6-bisphosphatase/inositol monophosphatase family enzyme
MALRYFRSAALRIERKADRSPVTQADRLIEERLRKAIHRRFPGEPILGEEFGASARLGDTYWTIDPIDGTRAFSCGLPSWGIMVGRVEGGRAILGIVDYPAIGTTLAVAQGVAAYERAGSSCVRLPRAQPRHALRDAVIFHGGLRWWSVPKYIRGFQRIVKASYLERAYGDCYGYLWVLRGRADAMLDYGVKPWDLVPFAALASATGYLLCDFSGRPSFSGPDTIMAHPTLARLIARTLHAV